MSTRAGSLGINLQSADTIIIYDPDFNPFVDSQVAWGWSYHQGFGEWYLRQDREHRAQFVLFVSRRIATGLMIGVMPIESLQERPSLGRCSGGSLGELSAKGAGCCCILHQRVPSI